MTLALLGGAGALRLKGSASAPAAEVERKPLNVATEVARVQPMPVLLKALGQIVPEHVVQVRPQVAGKLQRVLFTEGDAVAAGQRLFEIEREPLQAAADVARAAWENAQGKSDRMAPMVDRGYVIRQDYLNARSAAEQAQALYRQAQISLSYTELRAPIAGRTGSLNAKSGNIVAPTDTAPLVTINQMKPIEVQFSVPQQALAKVRKFRAGRGIKVAVHGEEGDELDRGELVFVDNGVNLSTGAIALKALLPNSHEQLWPGQFVGVTLELTVEPRAVVVGQGAVQNGQNGTFVYLVRDGRVEVRPVTVDRQLNDLAVIAAGLEGGERLVARVPRNLRPGARISTTPDPPAPLASSP